MASRFYSPIRRVLWRPRRYCEKRPLCPFCKIVQESLGDPEIAQIGQKLGIDPQSAQKALSAALPMIVGGMAGYASQSPDCARDVQDAMQKHEAAIDDVPKSVQAAPQTGGFLSRIFGKHQDTVQRVCSRRAASAPKTGTPAATLQEIGIALWFSVTPFRAPSQPVR